LLCGGLIVLGSILAYLSVYFTASQPTNYGAFRYKVYAAICIASFFAGILLCFLPFVREASSPSARAKGDETKEG
jgi:hypothetical protein